MSGPWRIVVRQNGGPERMEREDFDPGAPGEGQVRARITVAGVNYIDTYHRSGLYTLPLPTGLGSEFAGIVEDVGPGVGGLASGDRIGGFAAAPGSYATHIVTQAARVVKLPDTISDEVAAASMLKGITTWMLADRIGKLAPGMTALVHSAAGGVGSILVPWAKAAGATVIAHAGTEAKAQRAKAAGADHAFWGEFDTLAAQIRDATGGRGVDVVFDGVGATSWAASIACVAKRGLMVTYGNASGPVPPVSPLELLRAGSIFLTRPTMFDYADTAESLRQGAERLFAMILSGTVPIEIGQRFALADVAEAHRALEGRKTMGSTILIP